MRACHDLSEGGLATAVAEMVLAGGIGADLTGIAAKEQHISDEVALFAESTTRFVVECTPGNIAALEKCLEGVPCKAIGQTCKEPRLRIAGTNREWIVWADIASLKEAWQKPLRW
jgi:phosphoribosylformylglycinamidine synthase